MGQPLDIQDNFTGVFGDSRGTNVPKDKELPYWGGSDGGIMIHLQGIEPHCSGINATQALKELSTTEKLDWAYTVLDSVKNGREGVVGLGLYMTEKGLGKLEGLTSQGATLKKLRENGWIAQGLQSIADLRDGVYFPPS